MNTWILRVLLCLLCGISGYRSTAQSTPDPGLPGTYAVSTAAYNLGDRGDTLPSIGPVEFRGSVHYPTGLSGGPFPVLLLLHGRHLTCYKTSDPSFVSMAWPPPTGYQSITSFEGYDYFAQLMASYGYIVISISANAINSKDAPLADHGMQARAELVQHHLNLWNKYNTTGGAPFGSLFTGKLDLSRIGTMGHSRGGEGVVQQVLHNRIMGSPYGIKAVLTLAPVNFQRRKLNGVPIMNIAPYCDGDVAGLDGVHYYDDVRYNDTTDTTAKYSVMMTGANHNYFNTVWTPGTYIAGTSDDWFSSNPHCSATLPGNKRFTTVQQKATFAAYAAAFFRTYLEHDNRFTPILETDDLQPPASTGVDSSAIFVSYHPAPNKRRDINRTDALPKAGTNDLGGRVSSAGIAAANICGAGLTVPDCVTSISDLQLPHRGTTITPGLGVMNLKWDHDTDYYENEIPVAYQDISRYKDLQFRVAVNFVTAPAAATPDFKIQLIDAGGLVSSRQASAHTNALVYPPGWTGTVTWGVVPKMMSHTVKVPLSVFKGINQEAIRKLRILFDGPSSGAVLLSEFCFSGDAPPSPCDSVIAGFGYKEAASAYRILFTDSTKTGAGDTLSWFWRFGDPASGTADTSSRQHPEHIFSGPGVYKVCLYTRTKTTTGMICTDSVCKNISVLPTGINDPAAEQLMLVPNPAKDVLQVYGAGQGSSLQLLNLYGQTVFRAAASGLILLPQSLAPGVYLALVKKQDGRTLVQHLVINR